MKGFFYTVDLGVIAKLLLGCILHPTYRLDNLYRILLLYVVAHFLTCWTGVHIQHSMADRCTLTISLHFLRPKLAKAADGSGYVIWMHAQESANNQNSNVAVAK